MASTAAATRAPARPAEVHRLGSPLACSFDRWKHPEATRAYRFRVRPTHYEMVQIGVGCECGYAPAPVTNGLADVYRWPALISVEHMDFVAVPTQDAERSKRFYGDTLGLPIERETPLGAEFRAGQVTLEVWTPESVGMPFAANPAGFA